MKQKPQPLCCTEAHLSHGWMITSIQKRRLSTSVNIPSVNRAQFCALYALYRGGHTQGGGHTATATLV